MSNSLNHIQDWSDLMLRADWSVTKLAKLCNVSTRTLQRHILKTTGNTPKLLMIEQRQKLGLEFLRNCASIKETAFALGYKHAHHFSRQFKEHWGTSPARKRHQPAIRY
jgi:AraC family transcriptional regulator, exoenzyme S synthesis regulatory protein ExsA